MTMIILFTGLLYRSFVVSQKLNRISVRQTATGDLAHSHINSKKKHGYYELQHLVFVQLNVMSDNLTTPHSIINKCMIHF